MQNSKNHEAQTETTEAETFGKSPADYRFQFKGVQGRA
jgi:hypothetical protein